MTSYRGKYRLDFLQAIGYLISVILMVKWQVIESEVFKNCSPC